jgi:[ribosomal protein S18]-alanine N-acetyltransferase
MPAPDARGLLDPKAGDNPPASHKLAGMQVRRARLEDAEAFASVVAVVAEESGWLRTEPPVDVPQLADRTRRTIAEGKEPLRVLVRDGRVVGTLGLHETAAPVVAYLGMAILKPQRGRGGGRALLEAALRHAHSSGLHKVELEVFPDNGPAIALYASAGFAVEGVRREHYLRRDGSRRSVLLMALLLEHWKAR